MLILEQTIGAADRPKALTLPTIMPSRQEVLNVVLAQLLHDRGLIAAPEQILRALERGTRGPVQMPDVLVDFRGLRMAVEAEIGSNKTAAHIAAYDKAKKRVDDGIAHVGVAVVYPVSLRNARFDVLKEELRLARIAFAIVTEAGAWLSQRSLFEEEEMPDFETGNIDELTEALRRSYEQLVRDETLERAVEMMEERIAAFLRAVHRQSGTTARMAVALGLKEAPDGKTPEKLDGRESRAVNRIAALIIINAMIFQEVLSQKEDRVKALKRFASSENLTADVQKHWRYILDDINYYPIFNTAHDLLESLAADDDTDRAIEEMVDTAQWIVRRRASLRHDLAGRIFHRILAEAKYLGAYYTAIPSAVMLLKLALREDGGDVDWSSQEAIKNWTIADLACGTGTLLMAAADVAVDNHIRACVERKVQPELNSLHTALVEKTIHGFDVLPSAIHLTASTLALRVPDAPIDVTNLNCLRLGGTNLDLGSLDFFDNRRITGTLFSHPQRTGGKREKQQKVSELPDIDLCVMNPPFVRSVGCNLLFGNMPEGDREQMQVKLGKMVSRRELSASITAGLGSVFTALADRYLKPSGRLALVLPRGLLSGESWEPTRKLIAAGYRLEYVVVSHDPEQWNFSENTDISECLIVARKMTAGETGGGTTVCINLWRQPKNAVEALSVVESVLGKNAPDLENGRGALKVSAASRKVGEAVSIAWDTLRTNSWGYPCTFAQADLGRSLCHLLSGRVFIPTEGIVGNVSLCRIKDLGQLGYDRRDIADAFLRGDTHSSYPAFWGHNSGSDTTLGQKPNAWLDPRTTPAAGRPARDPDHLWKKAGRLLIAEGMRHNTMPLIAVRVSRKVLSNVWWTFVPTDTKNAEETEKCLALWFNSTFGFMVLMGRQVETHGAWVHFKKPALRELPVLDPRALSEKKRQELAAAFDELAQATAAPLPLAETDATRAAIDAAVARALGAPDPSPLRELLAREPMISQKSLALTPPAAVSAAR